MKNSPIHVFLVDDHTVVRAGLRYALDTFEDILPVGEASNSEEAIERINLLQPDVVLLDLQLDGSYDGIEVTARIKSRFPAIRVIILTSFCEKKLIEQALQAGAVGFFMKDVSVADLVRAIREAGPNHLLLASEATQLMLKAVSSPVGADVNPLTPREKEVLNLLVIGYSNREIAQTLKIKLPTARFHVSNILSKLGAANRAEAAVLAVRNHLLEENGPS